MEKEVLLDDGFLRGVTGRYVLVRLDFPRETVPAKGPASRPDKRREAVRARYLVRALPALCAISADGQIYGRTGYQAGGPAAVLQQLETFRALKTQRDALRPALDQERDGARRAGLLDQILKLTPPDVALDFHRPLMREIVSLDTDNKAGLRNRYALQMRRADAFDAARAGRYREAAAIYQDLFRALKPQGQLRQDLLSEASLMHGRVPDPFSARLCLELAMLAAPAGPKTDVVAAQFERHFPGFCAPVTVRGLKGWVIASLAAHKDDTLGRAFDGNNEGSLFRSARTPVKDDTVTLLLRVAASADSITVYTYAPQEEMNGLRHGVLEVSTDGETFTPCGRIEDGVVRAKLGGQTVRAARLRVLASQGCRLVVREFLIE